MTPVHIIFFGSTSDSIVPAKALINAGYHIIAVITQPPKPVGRHQEITPTPVQLWAEQQAVPVLSFASDKHKPWLFEHGKEVTTRLLQENPDIIISASFGQKIPSDLLKHTPRGGLNIHPSLLPRWRGADPVPWAILTADKETGVSVVTITDSFDSGAVIGQENREIKDTDFSGPLRTTLFTMGAKLLITLLPGYLAGNKSSSSPMQQTAPFPYARKFTRDDGFEPWELLQNARTNGNEADRIYRKFRALTPWPGVWTTIPIPKNDSKQRPEQTTKRLKILSCSLSPPGNLSLESVQREGKTPVSWKQFVDSHLNS